MAEISMTSPWNIITTETPGIAWKRTFVFIPRIPSTLVSTKRK